MYNNNFLSLHGLKVLKNTSITIRKVSFKKLNSFTFFNQQCRYVKNDLYPLVNRRPIFKFCAIFIPLRKHYSVIYLPFDIATSAIDLFLACSVSEVITRMPIRV
jgi:hypothetical protein